MKIFLFKNKHGEYLLRGQYDDSYNGKYSFYVWQDFSRMTSRSVMLDIVYFMDKKSAINWIYWIEIEGKKVNETLYSEKIFNQREEIQVVEVRLP